MCLQKRAPAAAVPTPRQVWIETLKKKAAARLAMTKGRRGHAPRSQPRRLSRWKRNSRGTNTWASRRDCNSARALSSLKLRYTLPNWYHYSSWTLNRRVGSWTSNELNDYSISYLVKRESEWNWGIVLRNRSQNDRSNQEILYDIYYNYI